MTELIETYADDRVIVYHGDCREVLAELAPNIDAGEHGWADAIVCDPPYELAFMGKSWDTRGVAFDPKTWQRCFDVLKPGGHLLAFGGSRTWHRLACAIEDSGFELRDSIAWLYGSGFPKSLDVSKAIDKAAGAQREIVGSEKNWGASTAADGKQAYGDYAGGWDITAPATDAAKQWQGWGTALKPAFEPIVVARKPLGEKTVAANVLAHGTGALNIDACRVVTTEIITNHARSSVSAVSKGIYGDSTRQETHQTSGQLQGRWPTNVLLDIDQAADLDRQSGIQRSGSFPGKQNTQPGGANGTLNGGRTGEVGPARKMDAGGASRFFPVFKYQAKAPARERPKVDGVAHPTVKPVELMRWLIKLVTPPGGTIIDPFAGSGTTIEAALLENVQVIGIEYAAEYLPLIQARIDRAKDAADG